MSLVSSKNSSIGFDAALPLVQDSNDFFYELNRTIKDNIQQNLKMLLYTSPGERIMIPDYGVGIKRFLFEQSPDYFIDEKIREQVSIYLPQVNIISLNISQNNSLAIKSGASNNLAIELIYEISGYNIRDSLVIVDDLTAV